MLKTISLTLFIIPLFAFGQNILQADQILIGKDCHITQMKTDADNNYYVTGYMQGYANFNPSGNSMEVSTNHTRDIFVAKYSPGNELLWINQIRQSAKFANTWSFLDVDIAGNVIIGGSFEKGILIDNGQQQRITTFGREDIYLLKMNKKGETLWWKHIGGLNMDKVSAVATDSKSDIYITGQFTGPVDFDPSRSEAVRVAQKQNVFLAKYSSKGEFKWVKQVVEKGDSLMNSEPALYIDHKDHIYLAGQMNNHPSFLPSSDHFSFKSSPHKANIFLAQYTTNGNLYWVTPIPFSGNQSAAKVNAIHSNQNGNIYITGYLGRQDNNTSSNSVLNAFVANISEEGENLWNTVIESPNHNYTNGICLNSKNEILLAGSFEGFFDLENGQQMISQDKDAIIIKLNSSGKVKTALQVSGEGSQDFKSIVPRTDGKFLALGSFSLYTEIKTAKKLRAYKDATQSNSPVAVIME